VKAQSVSIVIAHTSEKFIAVKFVLVFVLPIL